VGPAVLVTSGPNHDASRLSKGILELLHRTLTKTTLVIPKVVLPVKSAWRVGGREVLAACIVGICVLLRKAVCIEVLLVRLGGFKRSRVML
jgi:hypothetical protein